MIPRSHPRYVSLMTRNHIVSGVEKGVTSIHGLIAQGRGEAFDYLLGEKTHPFAKKAIRAAARLLLLAKHPVISVNGNACALVPKELVKLSALTGAPLEVNIFHTSKKREAAIKKALLKAGAKKVLMPARKAKLLFIEHNRKLVHPEGIAKADVVFVPLEDGDRCLALRKSGKKVVTVDLSPLSRTARTAHITIVDNIVRCLPLLNKEIEKLKKKSQMDTWESLPKRYSNTKILLEAEQALRTVKG